MRHITKALLVIVLSACGVALAQPASSPAPAPTTTTVVPVTTTAAPTTTVPATTTTTTVPYGFTPLCPVAMEIARRVGWPESELEYLDYIAHRESRCDITADGQPRHAWNQDDPGSGSRGLVQINSAWCAKNRWNPHPAGYLGALGILEDCDDLFDWETNLRAAKAIWDYDVKVHGYDNRWYAWRT